LIPDLNFHFQQVGNQTGFLLLNLSSIRPPRSQECLVTVAPLKTYGMTAQVTKH